MKKLKSKKWKFYETDDYVDVYVSDAGDIKCIYPKAPKWAADVAEKIWKDIEKNGIPTRKGVRDIVRGQWGTYIAKAKAKGNNGGK
jgi:hypothetical protein